METRISNDTLKLIQEEANEKIDFILTALGVDIDASTFGYDDEVRCACPVHGGDNDTAFSYSMRYKQWRCYTKRCHEGNNSIFGLVQKILSKQEDRDVGFREAVSWLAKQTGVDVQIEDSNIDQDQKDIRSLIQSARLKKRIGQNRQENKEESGFKPIPLDAIRDKIEPSWYFLQEGFDEGILRKYCVGYCDTRGKPMYLRSFAPVLSADGRLVVGFTGRTKFEPCAFCSMHHEQGNGCPRDNPKVKGYTKWYHYGFNSGAVLYNGWYAEPFIKQSKVAVITEGPKDVWWLEQHGVHNSLCIFGLNFSDYHLKRLISMGVMRLAFALDNDESGIEAMEKISSTFSNYFTMTNINSLLSSGDDIADVPTGRMNKEIVPYLKSLELMNV